MRGLFATFLFVFVCGYANGQAWDWFRQIKGQQNDNVSGMFVDDSGYVYATGRDKLTVTFLDPINPLTPTWYGHTDAFVAKYSREGDLIWATQAGGPEPDWGWGVVSDQDGNVYYTGEFSDTSVFGPDTIISAGDRDVFVSKLDINGNFLWTRTYGNTLTDKGLAITVDDDGYVYSTGYIEGTVDFGSGPIGTVAKTNGFLLKLSPDGDFIHSKGFTSAYYSLGTALGFNKANELFVVGGFTKNSSIGGAVITGPSSTWSDGFLAKFDTTLTVVWAKNIASSVFQNLTDDLAISDSSVFACGFYTWTCNFSGDTLVFNSSASSSSAAVNAGRDCFVAKFDFDGNQDWVVGFGDEGNDEAFGIDVTPDDIAYVAGVFDDTVDFFCDTLESLGEQDIFVLKLNPNGEAVWVKQAGGTDYDYAYMTEIDECENVFVGGGYYPGGSFDGYTPVNSERDAFVARILQPTEPEAQISDQFNCVNDTIVLTPDCLTCPVTYIWEIAAPTTGWQVGNNYYFIADGTFPSIDGQLITNNGIYQDTTVFSYSVTAGSPGTFSLGPDTTTCDYNTVSLYGPAGMNYYSWSTGENGATLDVIDVTTSNSYILTLSDTNNCESSDTIVVTFIDCAFIDENTGISMRLFIDASEMLQVISGEEMRAIQIYDVRGALLLDQSVQGNSCQLSLEDQPAGVFVLRAEMTSGEAVRFKFVVD